VIVQIQSAQIQLVKRTYCLTRQKSRY